MPAVLIEGGLSGLPAVATPIAGIPEIVIDGVTGKLVPVDDVAALAAALEEVLGASQEYGQAALQHCRARFEMEVVADAWERLLRDIVPN